MFMNVRLLDPTSTPTMVDSCLLQYLFYVNYFGWKKFEMIHFLNTVIGVIATVLVLAVIVGVILHKCKKKNAE